VVTVDSIRTHTLRLLLLPAQVGAQIGTVSSQVVALRSGADVVLSRAQLESFGAHPDKPDLAGSDWWLLSGDSTLTPTDPPS
jgi:hypothetical protein